MTTKKEKLVKAVETTPEVATPNVLPAVSYEVGIQGTELYNLTATAENISVQDLIQSQAVIEINTIMTLVNGGEGVGTVALYKSIKDALVVESIKSIIENDTNMADDVKAELKEFFSIDDSIIEEAKEVAAKDAQDVTEVTE